MSEINFEGLRKCRELILLTKNEYEWLSYEEKEDLIVLKDINILRKTEKEEKSVFVSEKKTYYLFHHDSTHAVLVDPDGHLKPSVPLYKVQILS